MFFKKKKKENLKDQYRKEFLSNQKEIETTEIDLSTFDANKTHKNMTYEKLYALDSKELIYRYKHSNLTRQERDIIRKIIQERSNK